MAGKTFSVRTRVALSAVVIALGSGVLATGPVSAGQAAPVTLTINPTEGPVGTVINFNVTGCPAVADGPDGRVFLLYGNFSGGPGVNPTTEFEGNPATGTVTVTAPPADIDPGVPVIADCFATPGEDGDAATRVFTITGATTTTTTRPAGTTTTTRPGGTTTTSTPGSTGTSRPAQPVRAVPSFTG